MPKVSLCYSMHKAGNVAMPSIQATRAGHCCAFRKSPGFPSLNVRQLYAEPRISRDQGRRSRPDSLCRAGAPQRLRSIRRPRAEHTETRRQVSMPQSEQCVAVGPTVVSASAKSTPKVKAYWGKTIPVIPVTPTVPAWHRLGWNNKYVHQSDTHNRPAAIASCSAEHQDRVRNCPHATYARHHTHTHSHSQTQQSAHRLVLQQSWVPGMNGAPDLQENHKAWCSELDGELMHINQTLGNIQKRSAQRSHQLQQKFGQADVNDTITMRARLNASVADQIEFFTQIQSAWCKMGQGAVAAT